jgi:hypothetical protein
MVAATALKSTKGSAGRKALDWFDDFTAVLVSIAKAERNPPDHRN